MEIKEIDYKNFGKCVLLTNGIISVVVTIDFGPRVIQFGFCDKENLFYQDAERTCKIETDGGVNSEQTFYYYGGHRLWLSTERPAKAVLPDNAPVVYSILPESVRFSASRQKGSNFQTGFEIFMGEDTSDIMVVHTAKNTSKEAQPCGLWPITMLNGEGVVILPQNSDTSDHSRPNRAVVLWPGTEIHDERLFIGNRFLTIRKSSEDQVPLKIGCNDILGWAAFVAPHYTFIKRYVHDVQAVYPDFGSSCEVDCQKDFVEIQSMSPMYRVEPGQEIKHVENLSLYQTPSCINPNNEEDIQRYISNLK